MIKEIREQFNASFTDEKYQLFLEKLEQLTQTIPGFRIAETPLFIPKRLSQQMQETCEHIIEFIADPSFKELTAPSIPSHISIPGESELPEIIVFDFGICKNQQNEIEPQLIEMQGFPSVFGLQIYLDELFKEIYSIPESLDSYFNQFNKTQYIEFLKDLIIGNEEAKHTILLEFEPQHQKTLIDFLSIHNLLEIETVCIKDLIPIGNQLFYTNSTGEQTLIKRIFNRIVFEDINDDEWEKIISLQKDYNITWINHPNWFYRISKYCLPFLDHPFIPKTYFLNDLTQPLALNEFVLKPIFSYAGMGVKINVEQSDIDDINNPEDWILQQKVNYEPIVNTPSGDAKAEVRLFYFWKKDWPRPIAIHNLARLSKGEMIGTRYNEDKNWVGGTIAFFESAS